MITDQKSADHLAIPTPDLETRRSMELEERPLPEGWVRQWDTNSQHHFYVGHFPLSLRHRRHVDPIDQVDTRTNPPRSIWNHPLEDDEYLKASGHQSSDSEDDGEQVPPYNEKAPPRASASPDNAANYNLASPNAISTPSPTASGSTSRQMSPTIAVPRRGLVGALIDAVAGPRQVDPVRTSPPRPPYLPFLTSPLRPCNKDTSTGAKS